MNKILTKLPFTGFMTSNIGGRKENQDTCGFSETSRGLLLVVCDGMGGGPGGKTASSIAVATIISYMNQNSDIESTIDNKTLVEKAIQEANKAIRDKIAATPSLNGMGTTAAVLLLSDSEGVIAHIGDSRVYQFRKSKIQYRTADHSRVGEMVRSGVMTEEEARVSPISNLITRALGIRDEVDVDVCEISYKQDDRFVLCTDGIWGALPEAELVKLFSARKGLGSIMDEVNVRVENVGREKGGRHDNYTMIFIETNCGVIEITEQKSIALKKIKFFGGELMELLKTPKIIATVVVTVVIMIVGIFIINGITKMKSTDADHETLTTPIDSTQSEINNAEVSEEDLVSKKPYIHMSEDKTSGKKEVVQEAVIESNDMEEVTVKDNKDSGVETDSDDQSKLEGIEKKDAIAINEILGILRDIKKSLDVLRKDVRPSTVSNIIGKIKQDLYTLEHIQGYKFTEKERLLINNPKAENEFPGCKLYGIRQGVNSLDKKKQPYTTEDISGEVNSINLLVTELEKSINSHE